MRKAGGVVGLVSVGLVLSFVYRVHYTSWPWQGAPYRLHYCDRDYDRLAESGDGPIVRRPGSYRVAFRTPPVVGREVLIPGSERCGDGFAPTGIYRSAGDGRYRAYVLLGGP